LFTIASPTADNIGPLVFEADAVKLKLVRDSLGPNGLAPGNIRVTSIVFQRSDGALFFANGNPYYNLLESFGYVDHDGGTSLWTHDMESVTYTLDLTGLESHLQYEWQIIVHWRLESITVKGVFYPIANPSFDGAIWIYGLWQTYRDIYNINTSYNNMADTYKPSLTISDLSIDSGGTPVNNEGVYTHYSIGSGNNFAFFADETDASISAELVVGNGSMTLTGNDDINVDSDNRILGKQWGWNEVYNPTSENMVGYELGTGRIASEFFYVAPPGDYHGINLSPLGNRFIGEEINIAWSSEQT
jgi:hypothetical protein